MSDTAASEESVRRFLEAMSGEDVGRAADLFHDPFLSLDPSGVAVVGREQLRAVLPAREQMFASIGASRPELGEVRTTVLDDRHVLARATWAMNLGQPGAEPLRLESTYLLRREGPAWSAVVYLNHHDVRQLVAGRVGDAGQAAP